MRAAQTIPDTPARDRGAGAAFSDTLNTARKFVHGAGSALLVFGGADAMTGAPITELTYSDFTSLEAVVRSLFTGELAGPAQIIAAALVFLSAGQCKARFFGLAAASLGLFLYLKGVTPEDVMVFADHFAQRINAAINAFLTTDVSGSATLQTAAADRA